MAGVLDGVDQRTKMIGKNRMELLLFEINDRHRYGINVFKIQEVLLCPPLTSVPNSSPKVKGVATIRGKTIPVMDLSQAIGFPPIKDASKSYLIISEYNRSTQGFLVKSVDRIINMNWENIKPPPKGIGKDNYMTAVTEVDGELVEIIDVEKVLAELVGIKTEVSDDLSGNISASGRAYKVLIVDDSMVARNQMKRTLEQLGIECYIAENGQEGLNAIKGMLEVGRPVTDVLDLVISDIEMPIMDGYTFVSTLRGDDRFKDLKILMHTSLSGNFNDAMVKQVGANKFIAKFNADELAKEVKDILEATV